MDMPLWQLKKQMCEVGHRIWLRGYSSGNEGNHSTRIGDDRVLCTPTGLSKGFINADDICVVDMDGNQIEPNPRGRQRTSEILVHLAIYEKRPDVKAVIHSHPPHATAFAVANVPIPEGIHPEAEIFLGKVPIARYATPSTSALPQSIVPLIGAETNTIIMGNHGSVSFSAKSIIDAYYMLEILDAYCRILLLASQLGSVNMLSQDQLIDLLKAKEQFGYSDERMTCATQGCIGEDNQPFLASIDVRPASATCSCNGGPVDSRSQDVIGQSAMQPEQFESLVQTITDQIVKASGVASDATQ